MIFIRRCTLMPRKVFIFFIMIAITTNVTGINFSYANASRGHQVEKSTVTIFSSYGHYKFQVEVARTISQQRRGLMYRRSMARDSGMLFVYSVPQILKMWMKNTFLPLDILFIDINGLIISVKERAMPGSVQTISSGEPAIAVLELNGGTVSRLNILPGDRVKY